MGGGGGGLTGGGGGGGEGGFGEGGEGGREGGSGEVGVVGREGGSGEVGVVGREGGSGEVGGLGGGDPTTGMYVAFVSVTEYLPCRFAVIEAMLSVLSSMLYTVVRGVDCSLTAIVTDARAMPPASAAINPTPLTSAAIISILQTLISAFMSLNTRFTASSNSLWN
jgi:hypothetical protein